MKRMISLLMAGLAAITIVAMPATINAQGASQQHSDKAQAAKQKVERKVDKVQGKHDKVVAYDSTTMENRRAEGMVKKDKDAKEADRSGNAYGRNKDSLQGRDFGQARAAQARLQGAKADSLKIKTDLALDKVTMAREKVQHAKSNLEKAKKAGKLSDTDYTTKMNKLEAAQQAIDKLEAKAKKGKAMLDGSAEQEDETPEAVE